MSNQINPSIEMQRERLNNIELSQADKESYFKSILLDKPYEETARQIKPEIMTRT